MYIPVNAKTISLRSVDLNFYETVVLFNIKLLKLYKTNAFKFKFDLSPFVFMLILSINVLRTLNEKIIKSVKIRLLFTAMLH